MANDTRASRITLNSPPMPKLHETIFPEDPDEPIYCEPTERGNFKTFLIPAVTAWLAPCKPYGGGNKRLVCFIGRKPRVGEGLIVNFRADNHIKTNPTRIVR